MYGLAFGVMGIGYPLRAGVARRFLWWGNAPPGRGGCSRRWRDASDGQLFGFWQRSWSTAPAQVKVALGRAKVIRISCTTAADKGSHFLVNISIISDQEENHENFEANCQVIGSDGCGYWPVCSPLGSVKRISQSYAVDIPVNPTNN